MSIIGGVDVSRVKQFGLAKLGLATNTQAPHDVQHVQRPAAFLGFGFAERFDTLASVTHFARDFVIVMSTPSKHLLSGVFNKLGQPNI